MFERGRKKNTFCTRIVDFLVVPESSGGSEDKYRDHNGAHTWLAYTVCGRYIYCIESNDFHVVWLFFLPLLCCLYVHKYVVTRVFWHFTVWLNDFNEILNLRYVCIRKTPKGQPTWYCFEMYIAQKYNNNNNYAKIVTLGEVKCGEI